QRRVAGGLHGLDSIAPRAGACSVALQRDAIHGDSIEGRLIALGVDVLAKHGPCTLHERQRLDGQTREALLDELLRLRGCQHGMASRGAFVTSCCWRSSP